MYERKNHESFFYLFICLFIPSMSYAKQQFNVVGRLMKQLHGFRSHGKPVRCRINAARLTPTL